MIKNTLFATALVAVCIIALPFAASAQNIGKCGWGSKMFHGKKGIAPQVFAATTNGTSGNQTFAISSGTSGCTQNGVVESSWESDVIVSSNLNSLPNEVARGEGETIDSLATVLLVKPEDKQLFARTLQENFDTIFPSNEVESQEVTAHIKQVLLANASLKQYGARV